MKNNPDTDPEALEQFQRRLAQAEVDYLALTPLNRAQVQIQFLGPFQGELTLWHATLLTQAAAGSTRNFIDIGEEGPQGRQITLALSAAEIDHPTILKALMMVRQYKRLRPGRHEFGPHRDAPP